MLFGPVPVYELAVPTAVPNLAGRWSAFREGLLQLATLAHEKIILAIYAL